jgi:hypothetical protein
VRGRIRPELGGKPPQRRERPAIVARRRPARSRLSR